MEETILNLIQTISYPGAAALLGFLMYKSGLFGALSKRLSNGKSSGESDDRLGELEKFRIEAETNHFHDLTELKSEVKELSNKINDLTGRIIRIETKLFNGQPK